MTLGVAAVLSVPARSIDGQGTWGLTLFVAPFPSPYQSDWEVNPNISTLTIVNPTGVERDVKFVYTVVNVQGGKLLASGQGDPLGILPGAPTVLTSIVDIPGTSSSDQAMQDQMDRTGRLPEGTYRACVSMTDGNNFVLGNSCATFTIVYPDPPRLVAPAQSETIPNGSPLFQWTPVQVPAAYQVRYALQIAERRQNQTAEEALNASIPHYQAPDLEVTNLQYPMEGQPFEEGKQYVWRVVAIDQNGFSPATNNGSSEIRSFVLGGGDAGGSRRNIKLSLANAFDHDPAEGESAEAEAPIDIAQLCGRWSNPPAAVAITADSPFGMKKFAGRPAVLYQNPDTTNKRWWISLEKTADARRTVLLGGDCLGFGGKARTRWIASKDSALQAWTSNVMRGMTVAGPGVDSIAFGMVVLALGNDNVQVPDDFAEGQAFLGGRELEVAPGLNAYAVLSLKDWGLWWLMQNLGFGEKEIEVKGFLGWDASWSLGGTVGADAGVDLSTERKFLVLTAELPKREPVVLKELFQNVSLAFEVSVGDSLGRGFGPGAKDNKYSLDLVGKMITTIQVNDELSFEGSIGLDLSRESSKGIGKEMLDRWDWLRGKRRALAAYLADTSGTATDSAGRIAKLTKNLGKSIQPGEMDDPEPGLDVVIGFAAKGRISSIWKDSASLVEVDGVSIDAKISLKDPKYTIGISGTLAINGLDEIVKFGLSKEFKYGTPPSLQALQDSVISAEDRFREKAAATKPPYPECGLQTRDQEICKATLGFIKARKNLAEAKNPPKTWRFRVSAGQIPLGKVLDMLKQAKQE